MTSKPLALVTGGTRGIGAAIVRRLVTDGYSVIFTGRSTESANRALDSFKSEGLQNLSAIGCELCNLNEISQLVAQVRAQGSLTALINNAGAVESAALSATTSDLWQRTFALNVTAAFELSRQLLPLFEAKKFGRIVNIASTAGLRGYPYVSAYCAAKHALVGFTRALALEVVRKGITVNAVCPSFTETDFLSESITHAAKSSKKDESAIRSAYQAGIPLGRFITPEEVASTVAWLVQPQQAAITGQAIAIAGGELV